MTREQIEAVEHSIQGLKTVTWMKCNGCPLGEECEKEDVTENYSPPCERALFEAVEIVKGMIKE